MKSEFSNTCIVTVSYHDRRKYIYNLLDSIYMQGIRNVVIVCNDIEEGDKFNTLVKSFKWNNLKIINFSENNGSAIGFSEGIKIALTIPSIEFIWLLDDDNLILENSLREIQKYWREKSKVCKKALLIVSAYRVDRYLSKIAIQTQKPEICLGYFNSVLGFNIIIYFKRLFRLRLSLQVDENIYDGEVLAAPYGGMFFHKSLPSSIGFPDPKFVQYSDDREYSNRVIKLGGKIFMTMKSKIKDQDMSWHLQKPWFKSLVTTSDKVKLYYGIRNRTYIDFKLWKNSNSLFLINLFLGYSKIILISIEKLKFQNLFVIGLAVYHGIIGKLGKNKNFKL